jgi:hypothetical protein
VVTVVVSPTPCAFVRSGNVTAPEEDAVCHQGADLEGLLVSFDRHHDISKDFDKGSYRSICH